jgi:hypoxanthine phosphoribosyltransferase
MKDDMKKVYYTSSQIKSYILNISRQMYQENFKPDYIVALVRGGLPAGVKLSHYLNIPLYTLSTDESSLWMSSDAFGYVDEELRETYKSRWDISLRKKILIIDDINDTGTTFNNIKKDWEESCFPDELTWNTVWHNNVKFASLIENEGSNFNSDFYGHLINKNENPEWCVFPWENWW